MRQLGSLGEEPQNWHSETETSELLHTWLHSVDQPVGDRREGHLKGENRDEEHAGLDVLVGGLVRKEVDRHAVRDAEHEHDDERLCRDRPELRDVLQRHADHDDECYDEDHKENQPEFDAEGLCQIRPGHKGGSDEHRETEGLEIHLGSPFVRVEKTSYYFQCYFGILQTKCQ